MRILFPSPSRPHRYLFRQPRLHPHLYLHLLLRLLPRPETTISTAPPKIPSYGAPYQSLPGPLRTPQVDDADCPNHRVTDARQVLGLVVSPSRFFDSLVPPCAAPLLSSRVGRGQGRRVEGGKRQLSEQTWRSMRNIAEALRANNRHSNPQLSSHLFQTCAFVWPASLSSSNAQYSFLCSTSRPGVSPCGKLGFLEPL